MATVYVDTDNFLDLVTYGAGDTVTARYGAILKIRESNSTQPFQITTTDSVLEVTTAYRKLVLAAGGYVNCVAGDVGKPVVGATTGDSGTLVSYDNATRTWWVLRDDPTDDQFDNASEGISITGGTGAGSMSAAAAQYLILNFNSTANSGFVVSANGRLRFRGDWYTLGTGDGSGGQTFAFYGSEACPYARVETGGSTNVWTDCRCVYNTALTVYGAGVQLGNVFRHAPDAGAPIANLTFGDGTNGMVVPNGARVQVPDIYLTSAAAYTATVANRSRIYYSSTAGYHDWTNMIMSDRFYWNIGNVQEHFATYVGFFGQCVQGGCFDIDYDHMIGCKDRAVVLTSCINISYSSGVITDSQFEHYGPNSSGNYGAVQIYWVNDLTLTRTTGIVCQRAGAGNGSAFYLSVGWDVTFTDCVGIGGKLNLNNATGLTVTDFGQSDQPTGVKSTSDSSEGEHIQNCTNVVLDGYTLISGGCPPYGRILYLDASTNVTAQNFNCNPDTHSSYFLFLYRAGSDVRVSNCTFTGEFRTAHYSMGATWDDVVLSNIVFNSAAYGVAGQPKRLRLNGVVSASPSTARNWEADSPYNLIYTSGAKTAGYLCLMFSTQKDLSYYTWLAGDTDKSIFFNNAGYLYMKSIGDSCEWEIPYLIQGVTAFQNVAATILHATWDGNATKEYAIKSGAYGSSWSAWTAFTPANISAESVDPDIGFYIKFKFTMTGAHTTSNYVARFMIPVDMEPTFVFPVGYVDIELRNVVAGSTYWVWDTTNDRFIAQGTAAGTSVTIEVPYDFDGTDVDFQVHVRHGSAATFYKPWHGIGSYNENGAIVFVAQEADSVVTADLTAPITFDIPNKLIIVADSVTTVTVQDLVNAIRNFETDNPDQETFAEVSGKEDIETGVVNVAITLRLTDDWRVQFEDRAGPANVRCRVTGGNLLAVNTFDDDPIAPSDFVTASYAMSTSATLVSAPALDAQATRDAMKLAPTAGAPAAGSIDAHLDDMPTDVDTELTGNHGTGQWRKTRTYP